ncbi:hypothetical protein J7F01_25770 [Streptomyces sp. ISL-22]|uniref:hypothetical protein n=1 Tax=unclassified Streptomyces TaxID=2593676 RepID=UPI001BE4FB31|nr:MULTISPECIES: hypothetical protein [unclassified Streptomyces]MBT2417157.1 hypothetical protein [Streptomyces sp. ISL-24]MBT2435518.1 hypothetical protein [Streptomyces sp. ISL-22]
MTTSGLLLYARSRTLPRTVAALAATAALAVWAAHGLDAYLDPSRRVPVVALAPLAASALIGAGLHSASDELDRTAVRPWWRRRLVHLLALTALAAALLPWAVLGHTSSFGPPAMIRNTLGCVGLTAASAVLLGARLSWLPVFAYVSAVYVAAAGVDGGSVPAWAWLMQPAGERGAWLVALVAFAAGTMLYLLRGARAEGTRD